MEEKIKTLIETKFETVKGISPEWFIRFFDMLESFGVNEDKISKALDFALSEQNLNLTQRGNNRNGFDKNSRTTKMLDEFYALMQRLSKNIGEEKFRKFLEDSLDYMQAEYEKFDNTSETCFKNLFLKCLVQAFPEELELVSGRTKLAEMSTESDSCTIDLKLGGMTIGDIHFEEVQGNTPLIIFTDLRTLPGLKRMGLGSYIFKEFCKQVSSYKPGYSVVAWNVMKDKDGSKVYPKWGAHPVKLEVKNDFWEVDPTPLTEEQTQAFYGDGSRIYYFSPETIALIGMQKNNRYGKECIREKSM